MLPEFIVSIDLGSERTAVLVGETVPGDTFRIIGASSEVVFTDLPVNDPKVRQPDITLARSILDWEPKVTLEQGLAATIDYFRTHR